MEFYVLASYRRYKYSYYSKLSDSKFEKLKNSIKVTKGTNLVSKLGSQTFSIANAEFYGRRVLAVCTSDEPTTALFDLGTWESLEVNKLKPKPTMVFKYCRYKNLSIFGLGNNTLEFRLSKPDTPDTLFRIEHTYASELVNSNSGGTLLLNTGRGMKVLGKSLYLHSCNMSILKVDLSNVIAELEKVCENKEYKPSIPLINELLRPEKEQQYSIAEFVVMRPNRVVVLTTTGRLFDKTSSVGSIKKLNLKQE